jgi:hypothetical protein
MIDRQVNVELGTGRVASDSEILLTTVAHNGHPWPNDKGRITLVAPALAELEHVVARP